MRKFYSPAFARLLLVCFVFSGLKGKAQVSHLVISQVYGGGGNTGATFNQDFVEIFNPTGSSVSVTGWKIQYGSAAGSFSDAATLSGSIAPGKYYLISLATGTTGNDLPTADATGLTNINASEGKVRLLNSDAAVIDLIGYGANANTFEGNFMAGRSGNTFSYQRKSAGCIDTDNNASDFTNNTIPNPRNSSSAANVCTPSATSPALNSAANATVDAPFDVTFTDDATWRSVINSITVGGMDLSNTAYTVAPNKITFNPANSTLLQSSGSKLIVILASGYSDATVSQTISAGAAQKLSITTQPTAPASNGGILGTSPVVAVQDQYGNATTSTAIVTAEVSSGTWTLGGTSSKAVTNSSVSFTDLTATSAASVTGATITFKSTGLTSTSASNPFDIPAPGPDYVGLTTLREAIRENMDGLANSTGTTSSTLPTGWYFSESGSNKNTTYTVGIGSSTAGDTYSFGSINNTERALGSIASSNLVSTYGAKFKNLTGSIISDLIISYVGEQWRHGGATTSLVKDKIDFQYSMDATSLTTGTWSDVNSLDFFTLVFPGSGSLDGNLAANKTILSGSISGLSIATNATFWIRFVDENIPGTDDGLAIDDISITPILTTSYTWTGTTSNDYTVGTNWTPTRTAPNTTDILNFTRAANVTNVPAEQVARLNVSGNAAVTMTGSNNLLQVDGNNSYSINVAAGSSLSFSGVLVNLNENAWVDGSLTTDTNLELSTTGKTLTVNGSIDFGTDGYLSDVNDSGNFILNSGATLKTGNTAGIRGAILSPNTGAIRVGGTRTFNSSANYVLNGNATASGFNNITFTTEDAITGTLTIDNGSNTVSIDRAMTLSNLVLTSGTLSTGSHAISVAAISRTAGSLDVSGSALTFTNSYALAVPASAIKTTINGLTISGSGVVMLGDAHTITGAVVISSGGLGLGGNIAIGGNFTRASAATFAHNNYKITMNGAAQTITIIGGGTATWQDLEIASSIGVTLAEAPNATHLTINGTLTLTSGLFTVGNNMLTLNGQPLAGDESRLNINGDLTLSGTTPGMTIPSDLSGIHNLTISNTVGVATTRSINVTSTLNVTGIFSPREQDVITGNTLTGTGTIHVTRTGSSSFANQYAFTTRTTTSLILEMKGTSAQGLGALTATGLKIANVDGVTLNGVVTLSGTLDFSSGKLDLNGNALTAGSITNGSSSRYIITSGGSVTRTALNGAQLFPIGVSGTSYTPVIITHTDSRNWTVALVTGVANTWHPDHAVERTWNISHSGEAFTTGQGAILSFEYTDGEIGSGIINHASTAMAAYHYKSTNPAKWEMLGSNWSGAGPYIVTTSDVTSFSPFAVGEANGILPVTFLAFSGKHEAESNVLSWTTSSESNNRGFRVERSTNGISFTSIGFVASLAAGGHSNSELKYSYTDASASQKAWYRLQQVDFDGKQRQSATIQIKSGTISMLSISSVYPNPTRNSVVVSLEAPKRTDLTLRIMDVFGKTVIADGATVEAGANAVSLNLSKLPAGSYYLKLFAADGSIIETVKLVKQ